MIMEVKLKFALKDASTNYESSPVCSYVFRKLFSDLPSSLRKVPNIIERFARIEILVRQ